MSFLLNINDDTNTLIANTDCNFHLYIVLKQFSDLISAHTQPDLNVLNECLQSSVKDSTKSKKKNVFLLSPVVLKHR